MLKELYKKLELVDWKDYQTWTKTDFENLILYIKIRFLLPFMYVYNKVFRSLLISSNKSFKLNEKKEIDLNWINFFEENTQKEIQKKNYQSHYYYDYLVTASFTHNTVLEIIWTIVPTIILIFIAIPSFALLYSFDEPDFNPYITLKVIGHQWYWSYEYSDYLSGETIDFDSYMLDLEDLKKGELRILEVDNRVILPVGSSIRILVTSTDVLHSWAVPSMGIKVDAIPGRLNQVITFITRPGVFYGQCSELCGINHAFMPIVIEAVSIDEYLDWVSSFLK